MKQTIAHIAFNSSSFIVFSSAHNDLSSTPKEEAEQLHETEDEEELEEDESEIQDNESPPTG